MAGRRLSEIAAHYCPPSGVVTSEFPAVARIAKACGVTFDPWQTGLGTLILGKRTDGMFACGEGGAVISICRQAGKTFLIGWITVGEALLHKGLKIIWTAHRTRTSDETFKDLQAICKNRVIARLVDHVRQANGQQEIGFKNGSRIMFGAREQGFGRGFSGIDVEVFDEAQILGEKALDDMVPATNAARNPLVLMMGTPPKPGDPSDVFADRRRQALARAPENMLYVEFSADRDAPLDDRSQWRKANPSFPARTSEASMVRMRALLGDDSFRREGLGVWDEAGTQSAVDPEKWEACAVDPGDAPQGGTISLGIDMPPDRSTLTVGAAIKYDDGRILIEMARMDVPRHDGVMGVVGWVIGEWPKTAAVVIDGQSPAMSLLPDLKAGHVRVTVTGAAEMGRACGRLLDMLDAGKIIHLPDTDQPQLAQAVRGATTRRIGQSGAVAWDKAGSDIDISPLVACTLALWGASTSRRHPGRRQVFGGA